MNTEPADRVEPGDPVASKLAGNRTLGFIVGLVALVGVVLAFYLFFEGGILLAIGFVVELFSSLSPPAGGKDGSGSLLMLAATMVVSAVCIALGLLDIAFRGLARKPLPGRSSLIRFCLITLTLVGVTALAVGILTGAVGG